MFENLLAQDEVLAVLRSDVASGRLPPALLFAGPPGSGKLTAALELARALSCTAEVAESDLEDMRNASGKTPSPEIAPWNCPCPSCAHHRSLTHPDLLLFGGRTFPEEIGAALELYARATNERTRAAGKAASYFFVRAVRKLLRRFDPALYEGEEARLAKAIGLVREVEEALETIPLDRAEQGEEGARAGASDEARLALAKKMASTCAKLEAFVPDAPPVFMIRNAEVWARLAPMGARKTLVIENADRMLESARNALLKILEEPPESVRFVLVSSRRSAMMATILSRSRIYRFTRRTAEGTSLVLERVFRSSEPAATVESFLAARRSFPPRVARERALAFLSAALAARARTAALPSPLAMLAASAETERRDTASALAALLEETKDFGARDERLAESFPAFLAALAGCLSTVLRDSDLGAGGIALVESWAKLIREARSDFESWNRSPVLLAETLLYAIAGEP